MLITSRETKRWIIPKGWPMKQRTPGEAAMMEAFEEAGLEGKIIGKQPVGTYRYLKVQPSGEKIELRVEVYLMLVTRQLEDWPESGQCETRWFNPSEAAALVAEPGLGKIIRKMPALIGKHEEVWGAGDGVEPVAIWLAGVPPIETTQTVP